MGQLLLLRHAKASLPDAETPDHSRPLDQIGRQQAQAVRDAMQALGIQVDLVLVSSARRTLQTLRGLSPWINPGAVEPMDGLYLAAASDMLHILRQVTPTMRSVLLIGHNPGLHDLALLLADATPAPGGQMLARQFPTAALAQFDVPDDWGAIGAQQGRLRRFVVAGEA